MTIVEVLQERVNKGFDLITDKYGSKEWIRKFHPNDIDQQQTDTCVVGRTFGRYWNLMDEWGICDVVIEYGFEVRSSATQLEWDTLNEVWKEKLWEERAKLNETETEEGFDQ